jgi:hypothetical protein
MREPTDRLRDAVRAALHAGMGKSDILRVMGRKGDPGIVDEVIGGR